MELNKLQLSKIKESESVDDVSGRSGGRNPDEIPIPINGARIRPANTSPDEIGNEAAGIKSNNINYVAQNEISNSSGNLMHKIATTASTVTQLSIKARGAIVLVNNAAFNMFVSQNACELAIKEYMANQPIEEANYQSALMKYNTPGPEYNPLAAVCITVNYRNKIPSYRSAGDAMELANEQFYKARDNMDSLAKAFDSADLEYRSNRAKYDSNLSNDYINDIISCYESANIAFRYYFIAMDKVVLAQKEQKPYDMEVVEADEAALKADNTNVLTILACDRYFSWIKDMKDHVSLSTEVGISV